MEDKPWWQSKTVLAGVAIGLVGIAQSLGWNLPYEAVYSILGAFGIYGVRDAIGKNKK